MGDTSDSVLSDNFNNVEMTDEQKYVWVVERIPSSRSYAMIGNEVNHKLLISSSSQIHNLNVEFKHP